jgi:IS5 family transposase
VFNLSDPGVEETPRAAASRRVDLGVAPPDETTVCRFRHLLEKHDPGGQMLKTVNVHLEGQGHPHRDGTEPECGATAATRA